MITTQPPRLQRIERVRQQLERWRRTRAHPRSPIPETVWAAAVTWVRDHGLYRTARAVRVDYGALKKHVEAAAKADRARGTPAFVELVASTPTGAADWVIEIDGPRTHLRLRVPGMALPDLVRLSRALAGVDA